MTSITLHEGDNRDHLRRLIKAGVRVHTVVTDPPYGLVSITKRFGSASAAPAKFGTDGAFARASGGFMGKKWDSSGIERDPEFWRLIWEILLPGGYVAAFSSPRTGHWQACAMETAGFIMHPFIGWAYGQGLPKAHNAAMAIDRELGIKGTRGAPRSAAHAAWIERGTMRGDDNEPGWQRPWMDDPEKVAAAAKYLPGSTEAQQWDGWAYGGQALKPALEPIYIAEKPFSETNGARNLLRHGVGAINIDGCRVQIDPVADSSQRRTMNRGDRGESDNEQSWGLGAQGDVAVLSDSGRHPANLLLDGSPEVVALFPRTSSGSGAVKRRSGANNDGNTSSAYGAENRPEGTPMVTYGDTGSAARFFNQFPITEQDYAEFTEAGWIVDPGGDALLYHGKAKKEDRAGSRHPTVKPVTLKQWLCRLLTPPGGVILDPFAGSGTTAEAARKEGFDCILMEAESSYAEDIRRRFELATPATRLPWDVQRLITAAECMSDTELIG